MDFATRFGQRVSRCESVIGYVFESKTLCGEALNAAADITAVYTLGGTLYRVPKNTRLAIFGDAVAASCLCSLWLESGLSSGDWNTIRQGALNNDNLARLGRHHGLHECIVLNGGTVAPSDKMIATAVEAILGAVRRDGGDASLAGVMDRLGLTQHVLLPPVTSHLSSLMFHYVEWLRHYSSGVLGPFAAAVCSRLAQPPKVLSGFEGQHTYMTSSKKAGTLSVSQDSAGFQT